MAAAATAPEASRYKTEKVVNFFPESVAAPFFFRCAAVVIDYILLMMFPVLALMWDRYLGNGVADAGPGGWAWTLFALFWVVNTLLFPLLRGQSIGKFLTGLTILNFDGTPVRLQTIAVRHLLGYPLTILTLGIGFLSSAFSKKGRALHDLLAGTTVVKARRSEL